MVVKPPAEDDEGDSSDCEGEEGVGDADKEKPQNGKDTGHDIESKDQGTQLVFIFLISLHCFYL
jgi:hypothetical protein